jgi:transposase
VTVSVRNLTDAPGAILEPYFASPPPRPDGRGRPWTNARSILDGVLFILRTGCAWADLPRDYPPRSTCHDRFQLWIESGVFEVVLSNLAADLQAGGLLDLRECFMDGSLAPAKRGGAAVGKTKRGQGSQIMAVVEAHGLPVAVTLDSATPHEVKRVKQTLAARFVEDTPAHLMGDQAYDSDPLEADLAPVGMELIAPHRKNRKNGTQDGRPLRRYRRRWRVERFFAWLQLFRRVTTRWEVKADNYLGFIQLACVLILLRPTL